MGPGSSCEKWYDREAEVRGEPEVNSLSLSGMRIVCGSLGGGIVSGLGFGSKRKTLSLLKAI